MMNGGRLSLFVLTVTVDGTSTFGRLQIHNIYLQKPDP